jgi:hypothetical protein
MERLNAFIVSNKPALGRFYDQIVDHPERGKLTDLTVRHHTAPCPSHCNSPYSTARGLLKGANTSAQ